MFFSCAQHSGSSYRIWAETRFNQDARWVGCAHTPSCKLLSIICRTGSKRARNQPAEQTNHLRWSASFQVENAQQRRQDEDFNTKKNIIFDVNSIFNHLKPWYTRLLSLCLINDTWTLTDCGTNSYSVNPHSTQLFCGQRALQKSWILLADRPTHPLSYQTFCYRCRVLQGKENQVQSVDNFHANKQPEFLRKDSTEHCLDETTKSNPTPKVSQGHHEELIHTECIFESKRDWSFWSGVKKVGFNTGCLPPSSSFNRPRHVHGVTELSPPPHDAAGLENRFCMSENTLSNSPILFETSLSSRSCSDPHCHTVKVKAVDMSAAFHGCQRT